MKIKFLKDVLVYGVIHKIDEIHELDHYSRIEGEKVYWCIGHGCHFPLQIGIDIELMDNDV
jgi:hypothetical protein